MDWRRRSTGICPGEIRVLRCVRGRRGFSRAVFDAKGKIYTYRIWNAPVMSPFELGGRGTWQDRWTWRRCEGCPAAFEGTHDFKSSPRTGERRNQDTARTINSVKISRKGPVITLRFHGDGFLYKMVRLMTGALVKIAPGTRAGGEHRKYLEGSAGKCSFAAPAEGLYLTRVIY